MKFRLKMDLSQFYQDERNLAYILVDPSWDQVVCLQKHVQKLFDVPEVQFLTDDGVYIPPLESIDVIKSNDVLRAIIIKTPKKEKKKLKSSSKNNFDPEENDASLLDVNGEKRKCDDDEKIACSTPNLQPKKKQKLSNKKSKDKSVHTSTIYEQNSTINELEESCIEALQNSNTVSSTINFKELQKTNQPNDVLALPDNENEDTIKSRKRKRLRKIKKSETDLEKFEEEKKNRISSVPIPISSSTLRLSKSMSTPNQSTKHVHFSSDDGETTLVMEKSKPKVDHVIYRCPLTMDCEARIIEPETVVEEEEEPVPNLTKKETTFQVKKPIIQIHENIVLVPAPAEKEITENTTVIEPNVQVEENYSVIEVDDSVMMLEPEEEDDVENNTCADINVEKILPLSEELTELPNVGDVLLFKLYRLSAAFTPEISEYICGRCDQIDSTKKTLKCLILDGIDQLDEDLSRLTPSDESQIKRIGKSNCFRFNFNEMLDKRVFKM